MISCKTLYVHRLFQKIPIFLTNEQIVSLCNYIRRSKVLLFVLKIDKNIIHRAISAPEKFLFRTRIERTLKASP